MEIVVIDAFRCDAPRDSFNIVHFDAVQDDLGGHYGSDRFQIYYSRRRAVATLPKVQDASALEPGMNAQEEMSARPRQQAIVQESKDVDVLGEHAISFLGLRSRGDAWVKRVVVVNDGPAISGCGLAFDRRLFVDLHRAIEDGPHPAV
jgi:hypothetical protein